MTSAYIQSRIRAGLAKAVNKTGSSNSEPVYLEQKTSSGGNPINPAVPVINNVLLKNAIFKGYNKNMIDGNILQGDRQLVSDNDVQVKRGDTIIQGVTRYIIIDIDEASPTSDTLVYISQVRVQ